MTTAKEFLASNSEGLEGDGLAAAEELAAACDAFDEATIAQYNARRRRRLAVEAVRDSSASMRAVAGAIGAYAGDLTVWGNQAEQETHAEWKQATTEAKQAWRNV